MVCVADCLLVLGVVTMIVTVFVEREVALNVPQDVVLGAMKENNLMLEIVHATLCVLLWM